MITDCDQIMSEAERLRQYFVKCYNLKASDMRDIIDLIESVNICAGNELEFKTINGESILGTGDISIPISDGTDTKIIAGTGISVTGTGSDLNKYVISNTIPAADGSETKITEGSNVEINGIGTIASPYVINVDLPAYAEQVNSDWAAVSGKALILNKPIIPAAQVNSDWDAVSGPALILNKPSFANTNLSYISAPDQGTVVSSNGTNAILPIVDEINAGLMSPALFTSISEASDNIKREVNITDPAVHSNTEFAFIINNLPLFEIKENEIFTFKSIEVVDEMNSFVYYVEMLDTGKGLYGIGGVQLQPYNIKVTSFILTSSDLETEETTQIIDLGTSALNVVDTINSQNPNIIIQEQSAGYVIVKGTFEGKYREYLWIGAGGVYGSELGAGTAVDSDLTEITKYNEIDTATSTHSGIVKTNLTVADPVVYLSSSVDSLLTLRELSANKQNSLAVDGTGTKFPTVDAVNSLKISISALRLLSGTKLNNSYYITNIGQQGQFYYDASDTTSADNTGTILVTADGKRYKRIYTGAVYVSWYGIFPNLGTDFSALLVTVLGLHNNIFIPEGSYNVLITSASSFSDKVIIGVKPSWNGSSITSGTIITGGINIVGNNNLISNIGISNVSGNGITINVNASRNTVDNCIFNIQNHAILIEQFGGTATDNTIRFCDAYGGIHGFVSKSKNANFIKCKSYNASVDGFALVSDNITGVSFPSICSNNNLIDCEAYNQNTGINLYSRDYSSTNNAAGIILRNVSIVGGNIDTCASYGIGMGDSVATGSVPAGQTYNDVENVSVSGVSIQNTVTSNIQLGRGNGIYIGGNNFKGLVNRSNNFTKNLNLASNNNNNFSQGNSVYNTINTVNSTNIDASLINEYVETNNTVSTVMSTVTNGKVGQVMKILVNDDFTVIPKSSVYRLSKTYIRGKGSFVLLKYANDGSGWDELFSQCVYNFQSFNYAAALDIDYKFANNAEVNLTGNVSSLVFSNLIKGNVIKLILQSSSSSRTVAGWDSRIIWINGTAPTFVDLSTRLSLEFYYNGANIINTYRSDSTGSLLTTTDQSFTGVKSAINTGGSQINGLLLQNNGTLGSKVLYMASSGSGTAGQIDVSGAATGLTVNGLTGSTSSLLQITNNGSSSTGLNVYTNASTNPSISSFSSTSIANYSSGSGTSDVTVSDVLTSGTGNAFVGKNNGVNTFTVSKTGIINGVKTYYALITQSSTGAPTVIILGLNTIGTILWTRTSIGTYLGTLSGAFTASKTACLINNTVLGAVTFQQATVNTVTITTADLTGTLLDGRLTNNTIKIEVYP